MRVRSSWALHASRAVLAVLALHANQVTPVDRLVDAVWDDDPPATARAQIRICVSDVRRTFREAGIAAGVETRPSGYLLAIEERALDVAEFNRLVALAKDQAGSDDPACACVPAGGGGPVARPGTERRPG